MSDWTRGIITGLIFGALFGGCGVMMKMSEYCMTQEEGYKKMVEQVAGDAYDAGFAAAQGRILP